MDGKSKGLVPSRTLAGVLEYVASAPALTGRQRDDMASALRAVARLTSIPLAMISSDFREVRTRLSEISPARHGLSRGRWANIRSLVYKSIDMASDNRRKTRRQTVLASSWRQAIEPLPYKPYRLGLIPFARFCSQNNTELTEVNQGTFDGFAEDLEQSSGRSRPRESYLSACNAWNATSRAFKHWPKLRIDPKDRRQWYSLPWSVFPASLKADTDEMIRLALSPDPLLATHKAIRPATARSRERAVQALASAVVLRGGKPENLRSLADLVELETAREGLQFFIDRSGRNRSVYLHDFARLLVTLGRHWIYRSEIGLTPSQIALREDHIGSLERMRRAVRPTRTGMAAKNRSTLRQMENASVISQLLSLPERVWSECDRLRKMRRTELIKMQVALSIEILTVAPIRRQNLVAMRLDRHLIFNGSGRNSSLHLYFPADEVKNEVELEFELSSRTAKMIQRYLKEVRPRLPCELSPYLFPGENGTHKCPNLLSRQIAALTAAEVGVRITAHQFRHLAGFLYLKKNPGGHEVIRRLLGHKSIQTTLDFYAGMEVAAAVRHYDRMIEAQRVEPQSHRVKGPTRGRYAE